MLSMAFTPISPPSEDMFSSTVDTRCVGSQTSTPMLPFCCYSQSVKEGSGLLMTHGEVPSLEEKLSVDIESCQFNKTKSTAGDTELDNSSEHSQKDSQILYNEQQHKPLRKQSLLANLTVSPSRGFETIILEVSDNEEEEIELGKRHMSSLPTIHCGDLHPVKQTSQGEHVFSLTCRFGHKTATIDEVVQNEDNWCQTCRAQLCGLRQFAEGKGGKCLSNILEPEILLECGLHHQWRVPLKRATKNWCKECKVKRKELLKDILRQETARGDEERKQKQNKMLEESRQRLLANEKVQRE